MLGGHASTLTRLRSCSWGLPSSTGTSAASKARAYPSLLGELAEHEELSGDERARLVGIYGAFGHKGWTGRTLRQRVADLEAAGRGPGLGEPWAFYDVVTYLSNQELHGSSWSLGRVVRGVEGPEGVTQLQIRTGGAENDLVEVAIPVLGGCTFSS